MALENCLNGEKEKWYIIILKIKEITEKNDRC